MLAGQVIGQLIGVDGRAADAPGRLVPLLTQHMADHLQPVRLLRQPGAQPARVRAFIDLAVEPCRTTAILLRPHELRPMSARKRASRR